MSNSEVGSFDSGADLRHKVRRLDWFRRSLADTALQIGRRHGLKYSIDDRGLLFAFFAWASRFEAQRAESSRDRRDFAIYAGGLMLFELLKARPARYAVLEDSRALDKQDSMTKIARSWPDGFMYTYYCLSIVNMILEQDFSARPEPPSELMDARVWDSFRENLNDDSGVAVAFFDVFMGVKPNWSFPESFLMRPAIVEDPAFASAGYAVRLP
jgi:hypothetical protein